MEKFEHTEASPEAWLSAEQKRLAELDLSPSGRAVAAGFEALTAHVISQSRLEVADSLE